MSEYSRELCLHYMTDGEALHRAIIHDPREEVPAGMLADYYDENGQSDVANIIRQHTHNNREGADYGQIAPSLRFQVNGLQPGQFAAEIMPPESKRGHPIEIFATDADKPNHAAGWTGLYPSRVKAWKAYRNLMKGGHLPISNTYLYRLRSEHSASPSRIWSSDKHKSGINVIGRHLQSIARTSTDPLMWVHALEALHPKEPDDKYGEDFEYYRSPSVLIPHALRELEDRQRDLAPSHVPVQFGKLADAITEDERYRQEKGYNKLKPKDLDRIAFSKL